MDAKKTSTRGFQLLRPQLRLLLLGPRLRVVRNLLNSLSILKLWQNIKSREDSAARPGHVG